MKRITITVVVVLLAVPVTALAKLGVGFQTDPAEVATGATQKFSVVLMRDARGPNGEAKPYAGGARPLITFRSGSSGRVLRVRASRLANGMATGTVAFPDRGPWAVTMSYRGHVINSPEERGPGFTVGTAVAPIVSETVLPPAPRDQGGGGLGWLALLALIPLAGGALWVVRRRGPRGLGEIGAGGGA